MFVGLMQQAIQLVCHPITSRIKTLIEVVLIPLTSNSASYIEITIYLVTDLKPRQLPVNDKLLSIVIIHELTHLRNFINFINSIL